jgi:hypothetical protein
MDANGKNVECPICGEPMSLTTEHPSHRDDVLTFECECGLLLDDRTRSDSDAERSID